MKRVTANVEGERFEHGADKYAAYLATPEGRLRLDLAFANLKEHLPQPTQGLRALDLGCGTGATAVRLAQLGIHVTLLDSSPAMLNIAAGAARQAEVADMVAMKHGDAALVADMFPAGSFDVILCHNILEYVDDPGAVLRSAARMLRDPAGIVSVLVRNQAGEVLKAAIQTGDLSAAEHSLTAEWGHESLYGGCVRLFAADSLHAMLGAASLRVSAQRGVRIVSDYLPAKTSREVAYERILELERKLGRRPEFAAIARYTHCLAQRAGSAIEDNA